MDRASTAGAQLAQKHGKEVGGRLGGQGCALCCEGCAQLRCALGGHWC